MSKAKAVRLILCTDLGTNESKCFCAFKSMFCPMILTYMYLKNIKSRNKRTCT